MLNSTGPKMVPCGTLLMAGCQGDVTPFNTPLWAWPVSQLLTHCVLQSETFLSNISESAPDTSSKVSSAASALQNKVPNRACSTCNRLTQWHLVSISFWKTRKGSPTAYFTQVLSQCSSYLPHRPCSCYWWSEQLYRASAFPPLCRCQGCGNDSGCC